MVKEMKVIGAKTPRKGDSEDAFTEVMGVMAHSDRTPVLLLMGGEMGSGKSTVLKEVLKEGFWAEAAAKAVVVEADAFKESHAQDDLVLVSDKISGLQKKCQKYFSTSSSRRTIYADFQSIGYLFVGGGMGVGESTVLKEVLKEGFWAEAVANVVIVEADAFKECDLSSPYLIQF
ncbi:putative zeta toxin domain, P-loop containing nucleoside triphosphate hydrolase [Tanacetum coccineum]